jgi:hypothetical protein
MKKKQFVMVALILLGLGAFSAGCGHNIYARGIGMATPWGGFGSGEFGVVKDNVKIITNEKTTAEGYEKSGNVEIGDQTTGYDVEVARGGKE